ncbi:MAG: BrnT family toxin [Gallionella sp.]
MGIEFDQKKAASNLKKHGVSFDEAASALLDPMALAREDEDAKEELRFLLVGMSITGRLLNRVLHTARRSYTADLSPPGNQE